MNRITAPKLTDGGQAFNGRDALPTSPRFVVQRFWGLWTPTILFLQEETEGTGTGFSNRECTRIDANKGIYSCQFASIRGSSWSSFFRARPYLDHIGEGRFSFEEKGVTGGSEKNS
jgi:hypothetical protein